MFQTIIVAGNLGKDPEMRYTPSGQAVTNFNVAVNDNYTNSQGERIERTIWFRVSTWGKQAEICAQYLKKGRKVLVEGRMVADAATGGPRVYQKNDGGHGASFEISASTVRFLSSKNEEGGSTEGYAVNDAGDGDIPF
jgi:single-strand DNA-binding protein